MWTPHDGLDHVPRMLGSARRASRLTVMQRRLPWARQDAAGRALALPVFCAAVETERGAVRSVAAPPVPCYDGGAARTGS